MIKYKKQPYWHWVAGTSVVWIIVLLIAWRTMSAYRFHNLLIFFGGWIFGVLGASIARKVYK